MRGREITLWLDERWYDALSKQLKGETLEEHLENILDEMCNQLPQREYERISHELWAEQQAEEEAREAARRFAVFHVTENGSSDYILAEENLELLRVACRLRSYIRKPPGEAPHRFVETLLHTQRISQEEFNSYVSERLEERTLHQEPESEYLTGSRRLCAEDISFADEIIQNDNLLEFYMEVSFNADQVFGTDVCTSENDDWLNIYANYDLDARRVCDTLEVYLQRGNGDEEAFKYRLSAEEQALLLPKMNTYCQEHWGQSLEECNADYLAEQSQELPEMQM